MSAQIRFLGHSFIEFTTSDGKIVLFDPWTKDAGNPVCPVETGDIEMADLVLVSHDHFDHIGSAVTICERTGALMGGAVQTMARIINEGFDPEKVLNSGMGYMVGGGAKLEWLEIVSTPAFHSSDTACALGTIVKDTDGNVVYHAGDTSIFQDMELFGRLYPMDVAILPIGGVFTMDAHQACEAARMLKPKKVIPIHYASFPILEATAGAFVKSCQKTLPSMEIEALNPGERIVI